VINPASAILLGLPPNATYSQNGQDRGEPAGFAGCEPAQSARDRRVADLHTTYGLLEEVATLTFQNPHFFGKSKAVDQRGGRLLERAEHLDVPGVDAAGRLSDYEKVKRTDTLIYNFEFRRVAVNPATLQVSANLIPQLSQPVRVGGPGITWFHDKRDPVRWMRARVRIRRCRSFLRRRSSVRRQLQPGGRDQFDVLRRSASTSMCWRGTRGWDLRTLWAEPERRQHELRDELSYSRPNTEPAGDQSELQRGASAGAAVCGRSDVASRVSASTTRGRATCRRAIRWAAMRCL
jgi:hypothetical protein